MARTLYMNDGSVELVLGDESDALRKIIRERLGDDCEELFDEVLQLRSEEACEGCPFRREDHYDDY